MKAKRLVRNVLFGIAGILVVISIALQVVLNSKVLTRVVNGIAAEYVDGDLSFSKVRASVFRSFPCLGVTLDEVALTYPHGKFAAYDSLYAESGRFSLLQAGRHAQTDTLASFRSLHLSLNYLSLLRGEYDIRNAALEKPRIFAHYYDSTAANWNILPLGGSETPEDTAATALPAIAVHKVSLTGRPLVVFTDPKDTLFGLFTMKRLVLDGKVRTRDLGAARGRLDIDSVFLSGRLPADTVALGLNHLGLTGKDRRIALDADAKAFLATNAFGRMGIPIHLDAAAEVPRRQGDTQEIRVESLGLRVATVDLQGNGQAVLYPDRTYVKADAAIDRCAIGELMASFEDNFPFLKDYRTDATLSAAVHCEGDWTEDGFPTVDAVLQVPDADLYGARIALDGTGKDLLGADPAFTLKGTLDADLQRITDTFTREMGIAGTGRLSARIDAAARLSHLDMVHIGNADIDCTLSGDNLSIIDSPDSVRAYIRKADVRLMTTGNRIDRNLRQGARILGLTADIDTVDVTYQEDIFLRGGGLRLLLQNSADILKGGEELTPLMGVLQVANLSMKDNEDLSVHLRDNQETFRISPPTRELKTPKLDFTGDIGRLRLRQGADAVMLRNVSLGVSANKHLASGEGRARRKHYLDSLQRAYPGVPRDSLLARMRASRQAPAWLQEQDFAKNDIDISLSQAMAQYVRDWDVAGSVSLERGRLVTPAFPLQNRISDVKGSFTNDRIDLENLTLRSGRSDLSAKASISGLRRALIRRGIITLDAQLTSEFIDADELMRAYAYSTTYNPQPDIAAADDDQLEAAVATAELPDSTGSTLLVIPANVVANLSLEASRIRYDSLLVTWAAADIAMKQRTLQVTNALAASNMGDIYFEGFYSTRSKKDIKAGFDLNLVDITAEKVITLFPAVDTIMPMLKTFAGDLDCELAATSDLDTCMNLVLPSLDGIMKISGKDLTLTNESAEFKKIARTLMFRNKKKATIDKMSVTGMIRDNTLEVFPFVLDVDRYLLAASGIQHLDESFRYHLSVIKSPLLVKFGINLWGKDFDHVKFGLGKARYRSANVPVFTKQLDTVQYSLLASIHNIFDLGVEKAIAENNAQRYIQDQMQAVAFSQDIDTTGAPSPVLDSLRQVQALYESVEESVESRREALKKEVVTLAEKAAAKRREDE